MKKLIDPNDVKNKVPLKDVLYMLSNAKNFKILSENREDKREKDGELLIELKTSLYDNYFSDVQIGIRENDDVDSLKNGNTNFLYVSEHLDESEEEESEEVTAKEDESNNEKNQNSQELSLDKETKLIVDPSVESVKELEDGRIEVIANGFKTIKDDFKVYSLTEINEMTKSKNKIQNNSLIEEYKKEEDADLKMYIKTFGTLDEKEQALLKKENDTAKLKYRLVKLYNIQNSSSLHYSFELVCENNFMTFENKMSMLLEILNVDNLKFSTIKKPTPLKTFYTYMI